jgi:hypothetical protein
VIITIIIAFTGNLSGNLSEELNKKHSDLQMECSFVRATLALKEQVNNGKKLLPAPTKLPN